MKMTQSSYLEPLEYEQRLLGMVLLENGVLDRIEGLVSVQDFCRVENRAAFSAMQRLRRVGPVNLLGLIEALEGNELFPGEQAVNFGSALDERVSSAVEAEAYARIIAERSSRRKLKAFADRFGADVATGQHQTVEESVEGAMSQLVEVLGHSASRPPEAIGVGVEPVVHTMQKRLAGDEIIDGLPTGLTQLDKLTSGLGAADLVVIGGRASMGKTAFALQIAVNTATAGGSCLFFSLEMKKSEIQKRVLSNLSGIPLKGEKRGQEDALTNLHHAADQLKAMPLIIDDSSAISVAHIRGQSRRQQSCSQAPPLSLIVIDYLQLMQREPGRQTEDQQLSKVTRALKCLAGRLGVPIILLSQLNREADRRDDHCPQLSDLRGSGAIEQDADLVLLLYRKSYYAQQKQSAAGQAEVIVSKNRNGPTGTITLGVDLATYRFWGHGTSKPPYLVQAPLIQRPSTGAASL